MIPSCRDHLGDRWLLIGGAGFIGSHVLREFIKEGLDCVILDNLTTGLIERIPRHVPFIYGDATKSNEVLTACQSYDITGVVHLAAFMQARESIAEPIKYWSNNVGASLSIASILDQTKVKRVIFSSSCSVYGNAAGATENSPLNPISPYAMTKVASEQILSQACSKFSISISILRYFNVIGNDNFPESHDQCMETIVPSVVRQITSGEPPLIFGGDFATPDGTAIRDYLDVRDLARAHALVATSQQRKEKDIVNVSSGNPVSVKTIMDSILKVSNSSLKPRTAVAKPGDPGEIWAKPSESLRLLGWSPRYDLHESIQSYWNSYRLSQG